MAIDKNAVAVPAQSKDLDTARVTTSYGLVHRQVISIADPESPTAYATLTGSSLNVNVSNASLAAIQSGTWNLNNISGTVSLPTGAATELTLSALSNKFDNDFANINTNTTTTVKSGAGVLKRIVVNKMGTSSNTCTIYDNTSGTGTIIATIDPVHTQMVFEYDVVFNTGLTIVTATGTAADLTIVYQ